MCTVEYSAAVCVPLCERPADECVLQKIEDLVFTFVHNIREDKSPLLELQSSVTFISFIMVQLSSKKYLDSINQDSAVCSAEKSSK